MRLIESEERFRILSDNSPAGISARPDGAFEYLNPRFTEIFGYTIDDLPNSETLLKRVFPNPSYRDLVRYFYREDLENFVKSHKVGERVVTVRVRGGSDRIMHSRMVLLGNGKQLMTYEDITNIKKMEAELFHAQNMEAVATLSGGIAHAFNNILMGIQGYTALMISETKADHPAFSRLKRIEKQVKSGTDLTSQLLAYASGGRYEVKPCNMNDLIDKTSNSFGQTRKDITIHKSLEADIWAVEIDQAQIEQVLINLFVNAQQAMPRGGDLTLKTRNVTLDETYVRNYKVNPGNYVMISVTDTGVGIDDRTKERIFEPFFTSREMGRGRRAGACIRLRHHPGAPGNHQHLQRGGPGDDLQPVPARNGEDSRQGNGASQGPPGGDRDHSLRRRRGCHHRRQPGNSGVARVQGRGCQERAGGHRCLPEAPGQDRSHHPGHDHAGDGRRGNL